MINWYQSIFSPPTSNLDPLGMSFTASSAVEQNTGFSREEDVEKKRCFSIEFCLASVPDNYKYNIVCKNE